MKIDRLGSSARWSSGSRVLVRGVFLLLCINTLPLSGCGRSLPPEPPEAVSPAAIIDLAASASNNGVVFNWRAPSEQQRGKELKEISGYKVLQKNIVKLSDFEDPGVPWSEIGTVTDGHLIKLNKLREEARAQGKPVRRVGVEAEDLKFTFTANGLKNGQRYAFIIRPFNESGGEGAAEKVVQTIYRGAASEISVLPFADELAYEGGDRERRLPFGGNSR